MSRPATLLPYAPPSPGSIDVRYVPDGAVEVLVYRRNAPLRPSFRLLSDDWRPRKVSVRYPAGVEGFFMPPRPADVPRALAVARAAVSLPVLREERASLAPNMAGKFEVDLGDGSGPTRWAARLFETPFYTFAYRSAVSPPMIFVWAYPLPSGSSRPSPLVSSAAVGVLFYPDLDRVLDGAQDVSLMGKLSTMRNPGAAVPPAYRVADLSEHGRPSTAPRVDAPSCFLPTGAVLTIRRQREFLPILSPEALDPSPSACRRSQRFATPTLAYDPDRPAVAALAPEGFLRGTGEPRNGNRTLLRLVDVLPLPEDAPLGPPLRATTRPSLGPDVYVIEDRIDLTTRIYAPAPTRP